MRDKKTARYKIIAAAEGNRYQFFCDISGALGCTTEPVFLNTAEEELMFSWEREGKRCFNLCHQCGRWASDAAYNADTLKCIECSPWEDIPTYCPHCGERVRKMTALCQSCGKRLRYGDVSEKQTKTD